MSPRTKAKKFPLLIYRRYHQVHRGLSLTLISLGVVLMISAVSLHLFNPGAVSGDVWSLLWVGLVFAGFGLARFTLTFVVSRMAYVQCTSRNVKIQTPFMPVVFSYKRIAGTRPTDLREIFPPDRQKGARRKMLEGLWGETVIVVDLKGFPMSRTLLQATTGPFLLAPKGTAFVFLVKDWMGLNRQLADFQEQWRARVGKKPTFG